MGRLPAAGNPPPTAFAAYHPLPPRQVSHNLKRVEALWLWVCYVFLFVEMLGPPISVISTIDLLVLLALVFLHMATKYRRNLVGYVP